MVLVYTIGVLWVLQMLDLIPGSLLALGTAIALVLSFRRPEPGQRPGERLYDFAGKTSFASAILSELGPVPGLQEVSGVGGKPELTHYPNSQHRGQPDYLCQQLNCAGRKYVAHLGQGQIFYIEVAYETDVNQALTIIRETADTMAQDPQWGALIKDSHELLGVEQLSHTGIMIRLWIKNRTPAAVERGPRTAPIA